MAGEGRQCTDTVFAVRPCRFQSNPQTAASNAFQARAPLPDTQASNRKAQSEFDGLVDVLDGAGVNCLVIDDTPTPHTPDSIFPNNWVTTHTDGTVVLYPMAAPNRRAERRRDILTRLATSHGFAIRRVLDLSGHEAQGRFLEGTGSLVLDRLRKLAYACRSLRTDSQVLAEFAQKTRYATVLFDSADARGQAIYHTNVMMWIGRSLAGVCLASMSAADQRRVRLSLERSAHTIVPLSFAQLDAFAGNMLELTDRNGDPVIALSAQAWASLDAGQRRLLEANATPAICAIDHIERQSGGSVRCMLAEVFLPRARPV